MFEWLKRDKVNNATLTDTSWLRGTGNYAPIDAGVVVTETTAMQLSAVFGCVRILAESISTLPLRIYERRADGGKEIAVNHPLNKLFTGVVNPEMTPQELIQFLMSSALLRGTAYNQVIRGGTGNQIQELWPMMPEHMRIVRDAAGRLIYDYTEPGNSGVYTAKDVWRVPFIGCNGLTGYSVVTMARQSLGVSIATERHAAKTFANGARLGGFFSTDGVLTDEAFERLSGELNGALRGVDNATKTPLLEQGLKFNGVAMNNDDAQFLESRKFQIAEVCRWFRVPLHLVNEMSAATFSNIEHQSIEFVTHTIRPWAKRIEQTITRDLIPADQRGRYYAEFNLDALLRGDTATRYAAHASSIVNGWKSRNEVRQIENLNTVDGLDEYLTQLNMAKAEPEKEPEKEPADPQAIMQKMNAREVKAIRAEYQIKKGDDFTKWVKAFYKRMANKLEKAGADAKTAVDWADKRLKDVLTAPDVPALLDKWDAKA